MSLTLEIDNNIAENALRRVSLGPIAFNLGGFAHAPNLRNKINQGQYAAGADEMLDITNGGTAGLVLRRQREHDMFMNGVYNWVH